MNSSNKKIALQLYSVRAVGSFEHRLQLAKETGYSWVETEVTYGLSSHVFAATLQRHQIRLASMHVEMADLRDRLPCILEALALCECSQLVMPWLEEDERPKDIAGWIKFAQQLNQYAIKLAEHDIQLAYHNHAFEFERLENGRAILEVILEHAPQVQWQADVAWVVRAGENPLFWLERYQERLQSVHVKDLALHGSNPEENDWANLGEGQIAWTQILQSLPGDFRTYIVEHDQPKDPRRTASVGHAFLTKYFAQ
jgi:sugar phosphate isomerase/epimerase